MEGLEFYTCENELWCKTDDGKNFLVDDSETELVTSVLMKIRDCYPDAYKSLENIYQKSSANNAYYKYLMVRRFCKCNFSNLDTTKYDIEDIDRSGNFNFEKVSCPMRGECMHEGVICMPRFNSKLSPAENRVMRLLYKGLNKEQIAEELFISPETVNNHIKNSYYKLGVHEKAEFYRKAKENNMFND